MIDEIVLSEADVDHLASIHRAMTERTKGQPVITLNFLFSRWQRFIKDLEEGAECDSAEYVNEVSHRDLIEQIVSVSPNELQLRISKALKPWDDRYKAATGAVSRKVSASDRHKAWWWFRCPRSWAWFSDYGVHDG